MQAGPIIFRSLRLSGSACADPGCARTPGENNPAKQSQFAPGQGSGGRIRDEQCCKTKPNLGGIGRMGGCICCAPVRASKATPDGVTTNGERRVKNNAKTIGASKCQVGRHGQARRAKQSQFTGLIQRKWRPTNPTERSYRSDTRSATGEKTKPNRLETRTKGPGNQRKTMGDIGFEPMASRV
jgi:hypothetical protein